MGWKKLGHVFVPAGNHAWMRSHASNPVAEHRGGSRFRVYFSSRDSDNRSSIGWVEIDLSHPQDILAVSEKPVLSPGERGTFDDSGVTVASLVPGADGDYLYYLGWNLGVTVPWRNSIGLAIRKTGESHFSRYAPVPVMDRDAIDPYTISYPSVLREADQWRMWYGTHLRWKDAHADMDHVIRAATSTDGIHWKRETAIAIGIEAPGEYAFARPSVVSEGELYRMWYAFRGERYRIGYAESANGFLWQRKDAEAGITVSQTGFDSEMITYPHVFRHDDALYMLYNGNGYGQTGFGLARLE